ncbi:MAG: 4-oxalocrotonate tautomerase [Gallionella sp.]|nr:4-oxalocrotonate tautomerase [Gallionella sp.]
MKINERCTRACSRTSGLRPSASQAHTYISFDELPDENWAIAGKLLDED